MSRLRSTPRRGAFAVPLADLRIVNCRSSTYGAAIRFELPGRKPRQAGPAIPRGAESLNGGIQTLTINAPRIVGAVQAPPELDYSG